MNSKTDYNDMSEDLNEIPTTGIDTSERNRVLDNEVLFPGEDVAGIELRRITAGDLALLIEAGVGLVIGRSDSVAFDVGAILFSQSKPKAEIRKLAANRNAFRAAVYDFLDAYEPAVFQEATPRIIELVDRMNSVKTAVKGDACMGGENDPKAGGQAG
jgi:hypothetical protein